MAEEMSRERAEKLLRGGPEGIREWNEWRESGNDTPDLSKIDLSHAQLEGANLDHVTLDEANLENARLQEATLNYAYLNGANLNHARLEKAELGFALLERAQLNFTRLEEADLKFALLEGATLTKANLQGANLRKANLQGGYFNYAQLEEADLSFAGLQGAVFYEAHLEGSKLDNARLEGAYLSNSHLEGASLTMATVDGVTLMSQITINDETDMTGVGLGNVRIEPHIRSQLECNIRRIGWEERYNKWKIKEKWRWFPFDWKLPGSWTWAFPGRLLWLSDYGSSTWKIVLWFLLFSIFFAIIYWLPTPAPAWAFWPTFDCEPLVTNLDTYEVRERIVDSVIEPEEVPLGFGMTFLRSCYFSVVTMTTLGFGDIHAHPQSVWGHLLLMLQVILGYILLGALITRFAILFQSVE